MGLNTTVIILNDALNQIEDDPEFGRNLALAIQGGGYGDGTVRAGNHMNAAQVVETHHADANVVVVVGGNRGELLRGGYASSRTTPEEAAVQVLKDLGYTIYKRKNR